MILDLLPEGDPILKNPVPEYTGEVSDMEAIAQDLTETLLHHNAVGLAANQCGLPHRAFAMLMDGNSLMRVCFNPEVLNEIGEPVAMVEGCLSFPELELKIKRPPVIQVSYTTPDGLTGTETLQGWEARCFQHELDHLNGVTFDTRVGSFALKRARDKRKKKKR